MLPTLRIQGREFTAPVVQGGMGIGVSLARLAGAVGACGGLGIISSVGLNDIVTKRLGKTMNVRKATAHEVEVSRDVGGAVGINVMVALPRDYAESIRGAIDGKVDFIFSGAGLPLDLPAVVQEHDPNADVGLVPIISSGRALRLVCRHWKRYGVQPAAAVLEGPLAGGHLGWKTLEEIQDPANTLEALLPPVLEVAEKYGNFPVIVAGGVYTHEDICRWIEAGASGVQMGTRFLATEESSANDLFKQCVVKATAEDIMVAIHPGSPCHYPFRILRNSPMYRDLLNNARKPLCDKGYVLQGTYCAAKDEPETAFCICNGLLSAAGYNPDVEQPIYTVGANAVRVDRILPVTELMAELTATKTTRAAAS